MRPVVTGGTMRSAAIAIPWFADALRAAGAESGTPLELDTAEWLAARGRRDAAPIPDWRSWLIDATPLPGSALSAFPAGACARELADVGRSYGCWACAEPVHLLTGLDSLTLAPLATLTLGIDEGRALAESLNAGLTGSGFALHFDPDAGWLLECATVVDCDAVEPAAAEGRDLRELLPAGRDGSAVRRLMNELQMLLHEHPVNTARERRGEPAVNAFWLWGFGTATSARPLALPALTTDDRWLAGLWRLHGAAATLEPYGGIPALPAGGAAGVAIASHRVGARRAAPALLLRDVETRWFAPLAAALRQRALDRLRLLLGEVSIVVDRPARFSFRHRRRPLADLLQ